MNLRRLRTLILREVRATLRDRFTVFVLIAVPLAALLAFGFVVSTEVHGIGLGVFDGAQTPLSRRIVAELGAQDSFKPFFFDRRDELEAALVDGQLGVGVIVPADFERALGRAERGDSAAQIQVLYDGGEAILAGNAEGYVRGIVESLIADRFAQRSGGARVAEVSMQALAARRGGADGVRTQTRVLFNPTLNGRPYMVAGTFGFVLSFLTTLITAVSIVNERLDGTFEQLQLTPATSFEILLGKVLPLGAVFSLDVLLMMLAAGWVLGAWPLGSALLFWAISSFYVITSLALGLILSATSSTPAEAVQKTVLMSVPLVQLSGFIYPLRNMPVPLQWVAHMMPASHYIETSRAIYLRGEGVRELAPELAIIAAFGVALVLVARRTLEKRA